MSASLLPLIFAQKSITTSSLGSPATTMKMLNFCQRHSIEPIIETFPFSQVNQAIERLRHGKPRYRVVLIPEGKQGEQGKLAR